MLRLCGKGGRCLSLSARLAAEIASALRFLYMSRDVPVFMLVRVSLRFSKLLVHNRTRCIPLLATADITAVTSAFRVDGDFNVKFTLHIGRLRVSRAFYTFIANVAVAK